MSTLNTESYWPKLVINKLSTILLREEKINELFIALHFLSQTFQENDEINKVPAWIMLKFVAHNDQHFEYQLKKLIKDLMEKEAGYESAVKYFDSFVSGTSEVDLNRFWKMLDIQTKNIILEKIPSYKGLARYHDSGQQIPLTKWNPPLKTTCLPDSSVETASIISGCATVALGVASFAISPHTWAPVSLVALGGFLASGGIIYKNREEISEAASNLVDSRLSEEEQKIKTAYQTLGVDPIAEMHVVEAVYKREKRNAENEKRLEDVQKFDEAFYKINEYKDRIEREKLLYDHSNINE